MDGRITRMSEMYTPNSLPIPLTALAANKDPDVLAVLGDLYAVLHPDADWPSRLERTTGAFHCEAALLLTLEPETKQVLQAEAYGLTESVIAAYRRHYAVEDSLLDQALAVPGRACFDDLEESGREGDFKSWLRLATSQRYRAAVLAQGDYGQAVCLMLMGPVCRGPLSSAWSGAFMALAPHLRRVVSLRENLEALGARWRTWQSVVEQSSQAFMMVDSMGVVHDTNKAADELLEEGDGLSLDKGRLVTRMPADAAGFADALQRVDSREETVALAMHRRSGKPPYHVILRPIGPDGHSPEAWPSIGVYASDPQRSSGVSPNQLKQLYGLTGRESQLLRLLLDGASLAEASGQMSITEATARTNLNRIFNKLGVRRQSDLMRLFWGSVLGGTAGSD